ncbi:MAG TPA: threonine ammonia-lyase, partial [Anaerolineales bacterium]|nr:threonine ammonia-lyase [Anaerolineales bacterium]
MPIPIKDIERAREVLRPVIRATPVIADGRLGERLGAQMWLKAENTQLAGSFKVRGAYYCLSCMTPEQRGRGVVAGSAGNHAQGVALAARLFGVPAVIVMPEHAPLTKVTATRRFGAEVVLHGASFDDAVVHAHDLERERDLTYVHAFNNRDVITGQGTLGLEIVEAVPEVDVVVVPIGGGGLISGIASAVKQRRPSARVIGVQAAGCSAVRESLRRGEPVTAPSARTIADGIAVKRPGTLTLPLIQELVDDVVEVDDNEIADAIAHLALSSHLVVEGAGAAGVAALLAGRVSVPAGGQVVAPLAGGNIDGNLLSRVLEQVSVRQGRSLVLRVMVDDRPGNLAPLIACVAGAGANVIDI